MMVVAPELRTVSGQADLSLCFGDPWEDGLREGARISQSYLADLLLRSEAGLSSIEVSVRFGWDRGLCKPRDAASIYAMVERWRELGAPLHVVWQAPAPAESGKLASTDAAIAWVAASLAAGASSVTLDWPLDEQFEWTRLAEACGFTETSTRD